MARPKKRRKVLLLEPNYSNKYPPIGLMKIATYHRNLGNWDVVFYKGDLKAFIIEQIADKCISDFQKTDDSIDWFLRRDIIIDAIKTGRKEFVEKLSLDDSVLGWILEEQLTYHKRYYKKEEWKNNPEWDRVFVTTLFTFYWDITIETINFAKLLVKNKKDLMVGGVLASIQPEEIYKATGIKPFVGILGTPGILDKGDTQIIDELPLDYSILDEIEYKYPMANAYYSYTTRGCIRKCPFCAVPTLEPIYNEFIPLKERIKLTAELYGEQRDLLLMDNNVLASKEFETIVQEIKDSGFERGAKFTQPNTLEVAIRNLESGVNDRAYIRKCHSLIIEFYDKLKGDESFEIYKILSKYHILKLQTTKKEAILAAYQEIKNTYDKHFKPSTVKRYVDFNQGVDARLFDEQKVELLSSIAVRPLRVAFDDLRTLPAYDKAIRMSAKAGIKDFSNYLLSNFKDKPIELYQRLKINVDLCEELQVNIYSFPMKFHPIRKGKDDEIDLSHNRDYIGVHWNRKYIRAVQAILNSTKGKIGRGKSFFLEAFGASEEEYMDLLEMPETFILYRFFFKWLDEVHTTGIKHWKQCWNECMDTISDEEKIRLLDVIHTNVFTEESMKQFDNPIILKLLDFYHNYRKDIITPGTELYRLKQEYDSHPTIELRRMHK